MDTVFYSWQSDLDSKTNRYFIETALQKAVKAVRWEGLEVEPRINQDARSASGAADIPAELFAAIDRCRVFVGDVSLVNQWAANLASADLAALPLQVKPVFQPGDKVRLTPNPNVVGEACYAARALTWDRVLLVFNDATGAVEDLPFDVRHRSVIRYNLRSDASAEERQTQAERLKDQLKGAVAAALRRTEAEESEMKRAEEQRLAEERAKFPQLDLQFYDPIQQCAVGKVVTVACLIVKDPPPVPAPPLPAPGRLSGVAEMVRQMAESPARLGKP